MSCLNCCSYCRVEMILLFTQGKSLRAQCRLVDFQSIRCLYDICFRGVVTFAILRGQSMVILDIFTKQELEDVKIPLAVFSQKTLKVIPV